MLSDKYDKARYIVKHKKWKILHETNRLRDILVLGKYHVFYFKDKELWSCECKGEVFNVECCHVLAMKHVCQNKQLVPNGWKL
jgi:hypothetical protein